MCRRVQCKRCSKPTWSGCGAHAEQVLAGVKKADRCNCPPQKGFLAKLFGG